MSYPFKAGLEYGLRDGTLGLGYHMTEGSGGINDVIYLAKRASETKAEWAARIRGVSAHVVIIDDGTIWQMVKFDRVAGSFNPADRGPASGYYNAGVIKDVLGEHYVDPNQWSLVAEIAGKRADGPTDAQVKSAISWGLAMRTQFPTIRGAFGHHDQTDTKGCPGKSANMLAIFERVGGHGLFPEEVDVPGLGYRFVEAAVGTTTVRADKPHALIRVRDRKPIPVPAGQVRECFAAVELLESFDDEPGDRINGYLVGKAAGEPANLEAAFHLASDVRFEPEDPDFAAHDEAKRDELLAAVAKVYP